MAIAILGHGLSYLVSLWLARILGVEGFEAYVVASTAFILMVTIAPLGFERYALRLLPALFDQADWQRARGYLRYGFRRTLLMSLFVAAAVGAWTHWSSDMPAEMRLAIGVSCLSLPAGALVHYALEALSAAGHEIRATAIFRVAVPAISIVLVGLLFALPLEPNGAMAVACWGVAWIAALVLMALSWRQAAPPQLNHVQAIEEKSVWFSAARPFWFYRIALAILTQGGMLALISFEAYGSTVGAYAVAMTTAGLATMLATTTNRTYARRLSVLLEQRDFSTIMLVRRERLRWLLPTIAIFLLFTFSLTPQILALFRPEFVEEGLLPLRLLASSAAFSVIFALSPTYLKYAGRKHVIYLTVALAALLQVAMLILLVPRYCATGAAAANAISMIAMYGAFAFMASNEVRRLKAGG